MLKSRLILPVLLVLLLAGFGFGVVALFQLRFNAGDIYLPYSSLRADPLGTKALYESLQTIPDLSTRRFYQSPAKLEGGQDRVLLVFGVDSTNLGTMTEEDFNALQSFIFSGGRIVISLLPTLTEYVSAGSTNSPWQHTETNEDEITVKTVSFLAKLGLGLKSHSGFIPDAVASRAELVDPSLADSGLPASISWHSASYFTEVSNDWHVIYEYRQQPVIIERSFRRGKLVLSTDSYFVSNEALRRERHPELLAWLMGGRREVLFDETHLGVEENPGVAMLMRRYRLDGVVLGLLLVAGLFVWQNSVPLIPPFPDDPAENRAARVQGKESTAGLASLLRRSIPPAEILPVCFAEWKSACARDPRAAARLPEIERIINTEQSLPAGARRPVEAWQNIRRILNERL